MTQKINEFIQTKHQWIRSNHKALMHGVTPKDLNTWNLVKDIKRRTTSLSRARDSTFITIPAIWSQVRIRGYLWPSPSMRARVLSCSHVLGWYRMHDSGLRCLAGDSLPWLAWWLCELANLHSNYGKPDKPTVNEDFIVSRYWKRKTLVQSPFHQSAI